MIRNYSIITSARLLKVNRILSRPKRFLYTTMQLDTVISTLETRLGAKQKEMAEWKAKYNIKTAEEAEAIRKQQMAVSS